MAMRFEPVPTSVDFPARERAVLEWWLREGMMERYIRRNAHAPVRWSFLDGPITANNPMGVHHAWGRTYKDLFQRYHTMLGHRQRYQNGFDGQGLWIEVEVERELGFRTKRDIETYGIAAFVERCKERVRRFAALQTQQSIRLGYWMDWEHSYHTMSDENNYMIWYFLKRCWERGLLYKGHDVMPWCPRCATGISEHEIVTEGYQERTHPGLFVRFPLLGADGAATARSLLVWTTTPWTLTSNVAVAVHPELRYARVRQDGQGYWLATGALHQLRGRYEVLEEVPGRHLVGLRYRGPFDELPAVAGIEHRVIPWEEVSAAEGTGLVHIAPGAGPEDFALGRAHGLPVVAPLDEFGVFVEGFGWLSGLGVAEANERIVADLAQRGLLYRHEPYTHRYPVCWRCGTDLVFRLVDEWFIAMDPIREQLMAVARTVRWIPEFGLDRELDWLRNMHDWMISKKRYYGLALPIYECHRCGHFEVIGGREELRARAVEGWEVFEGHSPHRPWVDAVKIACPRCGERVGRIPDIGNPWLDAGIVPFSTLVDPQTGQVSYLGDRRYWREWFPADFITEAFPGQYRNWFYALLVMSTVLEATAPFRVCLGHALVRDETGREMHKSWGNAIEFEEGADRIGVDVMRWMFAVQNPAANINFGYRPADEVRRRFLIPLWNVYAFFVAYANLEPTDVAAMVRTEPPLRLLDRWILSRLAGTVRTVRERLDDYDPAGAARPVERFVEDLSTWYVRRSRRRFWKAEDDQDKRAAYFTLYQVLVTLARALAPFIPFVTEQLYQNLVRRLDPAAPASVHLTDFPLPDVGRIDPALEAQVEAVRRLVSLGRAARQRIRLRTRQPLPAALLVTRRADLAAAPELLEHLAEELNVKAVRLLEDAAPYARYEVRPRFDRLGPRFGPRVQTVAARLRELDPLGLLRRLEGAGRVTVEVDGEAVVVESDEVEVRLQAADGYVAEGLAGEVVVLDTRLTPELRREGQARELVHHVQQLRKEAGLDLADRIVLFVDGDGVEEVLAAHGDYVRRETLAVALERALPPDVPARSVRLDGLEVRVGLRRQGAG
ncbi:MAG: isoleucine--tRNA ligase [Armatimonadota bacterium]|nr:isoleucine--tRNA ligase [Armatimonadota bacterium]